MNYSKDDFLDFDFHASSSEGQVDAKTIFEAFVECKKSLEHVPKKFRDKSFNLSMHRLMRESLKSGKDGVKLFRKKADAKESTSLYWLARVKEAAYFFEAWREMPSFEPIDSDFLNDFARLSEEPSNIKNVENILADRGIIVVHEKSIPGMKIDGACFLMDTGRPVIAMSLRYARLDIYWFVLMHELSHVVLHYDHLIHPILDDIDDMAVEEIEIEANALAAKSLIPRNLWRSANVKYDASEAEVFALAREARTHPAIVVGRLQRETGKHNIFSNIINSENSRKIIFGHE